MFERILIANRGEIAVRIIRACKELGIKTIAVHSVADKDSMHVRMADWAICIGDNPSNSSYLHIPSLIKAAEIFDVEAIHPGYGFLAEDANFAETCASCRIKFIGPSPDAIRKMGEKSLARETAKKAGVPVIPGSDGVVKDAADALRVVDKIKYPVIIKASFGGGGRGMRVAHNEPTLISALSTAQAEAQAAFGNGDVYIEKFLENPRHVEIQVLCDSHGNRVHIGERDCSIQRRHQKLIEESPSPAVTEDIRKKMTRAALRLCEAVNYENAGTVEFLLDKDGNFYFMEMNTRIQVEHTVSEIVYDLDLIKHQISIAFGDRLGIEQKYITRKEHAIECRINAEDVSRNFAPCPGKIEFCSFPGGPNVRVDSHIYSGYKIPPYYDSMLAKLITWGKDRKSAIKTMNRALDEFIIDGVKTTIPFHKRMINHSRFVSGDFGINFGEEFISSQKW